MATSECKRGLFELQQDIRTVRDEFPDAIAEELRGIMEQVKDRAVELCPKDTGSLASSISLEEGTISSSSTGQGSEFYNCQIYAGNESIINPKTGKPTSEYAQLVHDGHAMRDGSMWEGEPFLEDAMSEFEPLLEDAVSRALQSLEIGDYNVPSTYQKGDETD
jgi:hypothetical protein